MKKLAAGDLSLVLVILLVAIRRSKSGGDSQPSAAEEQAGIGVRK
jgi:hypothetical protein